MLCTDCCISLLQVQPHISLVNGSIGISVGARFAPTKFSRTALKVTFARQGISMEWSWAYGKASYKLPIQLTPFVSSTTVALALALPFGLFALGRHLYLRWTEHQKEKDFLEESNETGAAAVVARQLALQQQRVLQPLADKRKFEEAGQDGLVILAATFGPDENGDARGTFIGIFFRNNTHRP
jgi:hypothetical protein